MLTGRRFRIEFTEQQEAFAERIGSVCRAVWNIGLEQRREYRRRGAWMNYREQAGELGGGEGGASVAGRGAGALLAAGIDGSGQGVPRVWDVSGGGAFCAALGAVVPVSRRFRDGRGAA
jgi:putative transposase